MFGFPKFESSGGPTRAMLGQTYYINIHRFQIFYGWAYVRDGPVKIPKVTCEIVGPQRICAHQPLGDS